MSHPVIQPVPIDATVVTKAFWAQAWDRALKTAIQNLVVFLGPGTTLFDIDWQDALIASAVTVALSLFLSIATSRIYEVESFSIDLAQRAAKTFAATFVGALAAVDNFNVNEWKQAASLALSATVLSLLTSYVSKNVGTPGTASLLPKADLPTIAAVLQVVDPIRNEVEERIEHLSTSFAGTELRLGDSDD